MDRRDFMKASLLGVGALLGNGRNRSKRVVARAQQIHRVQEPG